jgi:acyl-CoA synthetase (AMP-forming)/AMP-acid ligase II
VPVSANVFSVLDRVADSSRGDLPAFVFEGEARTFRELRERSLRVAAGLSARGVGPGDRVAVLLGNGHEWTELFFGIAALGGVCVPVNVLLEAPEVDHVCAESGARCLVVDDLGAPLLERMTAVPPTVVTVGADYEAMLAGAEPVMPGSGPVATDVFILYYSSGTTGLPKAAAHTHAGILWNSYGQIHDLGLTPDDVYLVVPSLSWAAGFHDVVLALLWIGGHSVLMPTGGTTVERITSAFEASGATRTLLVPTLLKQFLASPEHLERVRAAPLRWILSGAEPVPRPVIEKIAAELPGVDVLQGYGLSEFPTIATVLTADCAISHAGTAGRPTSVTQLAIQGDDGTIAPSGEGEILIRSPATMLEYFGRPEETAAAFADGWLHTGDLGRVDADGFLTVTGRKKDMIISGGLNVYPKEVEDVIHGVEGVREVCVVGVPDERWGEMAVAVVVGGESEPVAAACRERLASYKRPRRILVRAEPLPRNATGKILKREVRPWAEAAIARSEGD